MDNFPAEEQGGGGGGGGGVPLLSQVLQAVATSQFLNTAELGRLLLLTSKELAAAAFHSENEVWGILCCSQWGIPYDVDVLDTMLAPFSSAEQCFRHSVAPPQRQVPRELQYSPEDYVMYIKVCKSENKLFGKAFRNQPIFGKAIRGHQIPEFFRTGKMNPVSSDHLHGFKKIKNAFDDNGALVYVASEWNADHEIWLPRLDVKVTIIRIPDQRSINLVNCKVWYNLSPFGENEWSFHADQIHRDHQYEPKPPMNPTYGRALFEPCRHEMAAAAAAAYDGRGTEIRYRQIDFQPKLTFRLVANSDEGRDAMICISGFGLDTHFTNMVFQRDIMTHDFFGGQELDITFAHFLEGLDEWFIP